MHPAIPIAMVFLGCCTNVIFLELMVSEHPGSGNIITFSQFLFIALEGLIFTTNFLSKKPAIPMKSYVLMVSMFFVVQVVNNYVFNFNLPMPLHIIFRAGSLIASLVLGVIILKKRYSVSKYASVLIISVGIYICTVSSSGNKSRDDGGTPDKYSDYVNTFIGVGLLCFSLFMTARMGIFQEQIYKQFGKHPKESLFYNHFLPLPGFLLVAKDIYRHVLLFNQSAPLVVPVISLHIPKMWVFLAGNVVTQYMCIRSVFILTTECSALTVTLVVTLRKFMSLIFSILYFKNPFTFNHWIGALFVFGGTLAFTEVIPIGKSDKDKKRE